MNQKECGICLPVRKCQAVGELARRETISDGFSIVVFEPMSKCPIVRAVTRHPHNSLMFNIYERKR